MKTKFLKLNRKAILSGLKVMVLIFFVISTIVCTILYNNNEITNIYIYLSTIISISIGFPILLTIFPFLRWTWDMKVHRKNFNSFPFCDFKKIGFNKILIDKNNNWRFVREIYRGELNGYIIDIDTDTQNEPKFLRFRFTSKPKPEDLNGTDFKIDDFNYPNIKSGFSKIVLKYHRNKNNLKSIEQLKEELIHMTNRLNKK